MRSKQIILPSFCAIFLFSCVSSKKFKKSQADYADLQAQIQPDWKVQLTEKH